MKRQNVKKLILKLLIDRGFVRNREIAELAGITRQAAHYHLKALVASGQIVVQGKGRGTRYKRAGALSAGKSFRFARKGLEEHEVWEEMISRVPGLASLREEPLSLLSYAFTELLNNAIEHSGSEGVEIRFASPGDLVVFEVIDEGEGIFEHARRLLSLESCLEALQEISKGKVTTDPEAHTGEGIFFVSKAADVLEIEAGGLRWIVDNTVGDQAVGESPPRKGTLARFETASAKTLRLEDVFAEYTRDLEFAKTRIVVRLFEIGVRFVSRSEARRLLRGLERFREVVLDFRGVKILGQGFADELFRVWARAHPGVVLTPRDMVPPVAFMVGRAKSNG